MTSLAPAPLAEPAVRTWLQGVTALCGQGKPLPLGVQYKDLGSPASGVYARIDSIGGYPSIGDDGCWNARLSFAVVGKSKKGAEFGATALLNTLHGLSLAPPVQVTLPAENGGGILKLLTAFDFNGPAYVPDAGQPRYIVDCIVMIQPAT